jgi:hypothetical protein
MTRTEAIEALDRLGDEDQHNDHITADDILLAVLRTAGMDDVAAAYERAKDRVSFYYS